MCKKLQTNIYIANNKYRIQNNIPLEISHSRENVCSDMSSYKYVYIPDEVRVRYAAL